MPYFKRCVSSHFDIRRASKRGVNFHWFLVLVNSHAGEDRSVKNRGFYRFNLNFHYGRDYERTRRRRTHGCPSARKITDTDWRDIVSCASQQKILEKSLIERDGSRALCNLSDVQRGSTILKGILRKVENFDRRYDDLRPGALDQRCACRSKWGKRLRTSLKTYVEEKISGEER